MQRSRLRLANVRRKEVGTNYRSHYVVEGESAIEMVVATSGLRGAKQHSRGRWNSKFPRFAASDELLARWSLFELGKLLIPLRTTHIRRKKEEKRHVVPIL